MYVDSHCHVDRYTRPTDVLDAAQRARVVTVAVTETPSGFQELVAKAGRRPLLRVALGLHPLRAGRISPLELSLFSRLLERTDYVGEVGLDFSRQGRSTRARQIEVFERVLSEPAIRRKVLTVHSRGAEADVIARLRDARVTAVLHWYSGPLKHLDTALDAGFWFSVNPAMLASKNGQRILAALPHHRVLTETDGPYTRHEGRRSAPRDVPALVKALASVWQSDIEETRERLFSNMAAAYLATQAHRGSENPLPVAVDSDATGDGRTPSVAGWL